MQNSQAWPAFSTPCLCTPCTYLALNYINSGNTSYTVGWGGGGGGGMIAEDYSAARSSIRTVIPFRIVAYPDAEQPYGF